ncbi:protein enabled isoform X2 [Eupeodes corollae]|uniref:protein enabled isoform X2 n=1 Tax=Eupeodes corollae TaxID=290404 RepID=UPI0024915A19|nr:protein enabled isoform X2 [Eupeodes corollae]
MKKLSKKLKPSRNKEKQPSVNRVTTAAIGYKDASESSSPSSLMTLSSESSGPSSSSVMSCSITNNNAIGTTNCNKSSASDKIMDPIGRRPRARVNHDDDNNNNDDDYGDDDVNGDTSSCGSGAVVASMAPTIDASPDDEHLYYAISELDTTTTSNNNSPSPSSTAESLAPTSTIPSTITTCMDDWSTTVSDVTAGTAAVPATAEAVACVDELSMKTTTTTTMRMKEEEVTALYSLPVKISLRKNNDAFVPNFYAGGMLMTKTMNRQSQDEFYNDASTSNLNNERQRQTMARDPFSRPISSFGSSRPRRDFMELKCEQSIIGARASVMVYDDTQKKWVPSGSSSGLSKVQIYHHQQNNTFRVVGRKLQDHEVVINCSILKGLKYNQATATFHQWRDSKFVYGLNFSSQQDAEAFARVMMHSLEVLSGRVAANTPAMPTNGNGYEEDMGYRTMTREDAAILQQQQNMSGNVTPSAQTPTSQTNQNNIPQSPPTPQGHHRTSSAPPAPQPPPMSMPQQIYGQSQITANGILQQNGIIGGGGGSVGGGGGVNSGMMQPPQAPPNSQGGIPPQQQQQQAQQSQQQQQQLQSNQQQQQNQYHAPQQLAQQHHQHPVYSSQQMINNSYQQQNQYQQPIYVSSSSNPNLNHHQYSQQNIVGGGMDRGSLPPLPPQNQQQQPSQQSMPNGPIYVSSSQSQGIPSSASSNSVVYGSQQLQQQPTQQLQQAPPQPPQPPQQPSHLPMLDPSSGGQYGQTNGPSIAVTENLYSQIPMAPPMLPSMGGAHNGIPMPPPMLNRATAPGGGAPAAPPPPPAFGGGAPMFNSGNTHGGPTGGGIPPPPQPPAAPPAPPMMGGGGGGPGGPSGPGGPGAPPPPPPPPMGGLMQKKDDPAADLMGSLAAQLQQARLKKNKTAPLPAENSGSSTSSGGSGNYGTIGRSSKGMASMMDEMAKTLARRRAVAERKEPDPAEEAQNAKQRPWEKSNTLPHKLGGSNSNGNSNSGNNNSSNSGSESPRPIRKRFGSASEETILKQVNGEGLSLALSADLDSLKAELVREMRLEIQKAKQEIIDAIKSEFNRR